MSVIGNRHNLSAFVAGTSKPQSGQRLAKIGYKQTAAMSAKGEIAPASVCASVPAITSDQIEPHITRLLPYIGAMLESAQDGIIRSLYESSGHVMGSISDDDISVSACISYLAAEAAGDRLGKDQIGVWFDSEISENLTVFVAEKLGFAELTPDALKTCAKHVGIYRDLIASLAGGKTILTPQQINGCKKAIALCANSDRIAQKLNDRLIAMENPKKQQEFLEL